MGMWSSLVYVSGGATLVAFVVAALVGLARHQAERKESLIRAAPEEKRGELVEIALEAFRIDTNSLNHKEKFELAVHHIRARQERFRIAAIVLVLVAIIAAILTGIAINKNKLGQEAPPSISIGKTVVPIDIAIVRNGNAFYNSPIECSLTTTLNDRLKDLPYDVKYETATSNTEPGGDDKNEAVFSALLANYPPGKPDFIVTIGTQASEYAYRNYRNRPLVFVGVTDPIASGLVKNLEPDSSRGPIAGVVYDPPMMAYMQLLAESFPGKTIAYVYNKDYQQDLYFKQSMLSFLSAYSLPIKIVPIEVARPVINEEDARRADVFWGRFYFSKYFALFSSRLRKPLAGSDLLNLHKDAVITACTDPKELGRLVAEKIIFQNLKGTALSDIPIIVPQKVLVGVNLNAARRCGISLPEKIVAFADKVVR
ncbi:MAG TPA: ABC transporter substrate binding protein [Thermoanaerobaculia bacterium]|nr:ABC transporter substrate binding protein [Thermoanaerobaculia bacterium]